MQLIALVIWTCWNAGATALNAVLYATGAGGPLNLGAAIFCGLMFVVSAGWLLTEVRR